MAHFEIYILNFNGARYLPECLDHLRLCKVGEHSMQVNVVDNGSTDNSKYLVEEKYPEVNFISLGFNFGFSKGNNLGVIERRKQLKNDIRRVGFHVFLNNDTAVEEDWLVEAAAAFERHPGAGIVGSKSLFYDRFVKLETTVEPGFSPVDFGSGDTRQLGVYLSKSLIGENLILDGSRTKTPGAYGIESGGGRWLPPHSEIFLAIKDPKRPASLDLTFENHNPGSSTVKISCTINSRKKILDKSVAREKPLAVQLKFKSSDYVDVIQNAGSFVRRDGDAGDRGHLQIDEGQFDKEEEVASICGVSMFIKEDLFTKLKGFDERFFAYFEDTDLCMRARLAGYTCVYAPKSVLRHVHCGSGVEHSEYFVKNVAFSRFLFSSKLLSPIDWKKLKKEYRDRAKGEFELFLSDNSMIGKPHLRTWCRYLKSINAYLFERFNVCRVRPWEKLFVNQLG